MSDRTRPRVISFDLDGTLVDFTYTALVWEVGVPKLYAEKHRISFEEAVSSVTGEYAAVGDSSVKWYDLHYWLQHFGLPAEGPTLMEKHRKEVRLFPEVREVLEALSARYELIVVSNAAREFVEVEVNETGIGKYFSRTFSATSDFRQVKETPEFYHTVCEAIGATPASMVHVGDHYEFDYVVPRKLGMEAYYLDRNGGARNGDFTVRTLKEFVEKISNPERVN